MPNILLIEPDIELAGIVRDYLDKHDYRVVIANNAQDAVHAADTKQPDAVILELAIPKHNGIEFLQEFRSYSDWINIPVVIYTHVPPEDAGLTELQWQKQNVVSYLYKPSVPLAGLLRSLENIPVIHETT